MKNISEIENASAEKLHGMLSLRVKNYSLFQQQQIDGKQLRQDHCARQGDNSGNELWINFVYGYALRNFLAKVIPLNTHELYFFCCKNNKYYLVHIF